VQLTTLRARAVPTAVATLAAALACASCTKKNERTYGENLANAYEEGKASGARGDMQSLAIAITNYVTQEGNLPDAADIAALAARLEPTYVRRAPRVDPWGMPYLFSTDGTTWKLASTGADRKPGTRDDLEMVDGQMTKMPRGPDFRP
jgi:hypothetical protein